MRILTQPFCTSCILAKETIINPCTFATATVHEINQKMKSVLSIWLMLWLCILTMTSCSKNADKKDQINTVNTFADYLGQPININLMGRVVNLNKAPLDSVLVVAGNKSTTTDKHGNFTIKNVSAHQEFASLKVQRKGYKNTVVNLVPKQGKEAINIILHKETEPCLFWFCKDNHNLPNTIN